MGCGPLQAPRGLPAAQASAKRAVPMRRAARGGTARRRGYQRLFEQRVIERFLQCGDPQHGFARVYCPNCRHDYLLAFSCKARYFCPSCHQKRVLAYGDWVEDNVLAPVPHRQYVFTLPRMLRPVFSRKRRLLGELCHIVERLLADAYSGAGTEGRPGLDPVRSDFWRPGHLQPAHPCARGRCGVFGEDGAFTVLPAIPAKLPELNSAPQCSSCWWAKACFRPSSRRRCSPGATAGFRAQRRARSRWRHARPQEARTIHAAHAVLAGENALRRA